MLTFLIRKPPVAEPTPEDIYSNAVGLLFPDNVLTYHGDAGSSVTYISKRFGDIELNLVDPYDHGEHVLFAHHIWNSGIQMAEFISQANDPSKVEKDGRWNVDGETVLELGAGTGIVGITSALAGASQTVISDYPSQKILANLKTNVEKNIPQSIRQKVTVQPHEWGVLTDAFSKTNANHFTRILVADCLWMDGEHYDLAQSIVHFLSSKSQARAWVIAGFHTGRPKLVAFFDIAVQAGLEIEAIWERDADGGERRWERDRVDMEKNKWMVVAILKRKEGDVREKESEKERQERVFASMLMQKNNRHL